MAKITLKLIKGASYTGEVCATAKKPIVEVSDKAVADRAIASGYFEIVTADSTASVPENAGETPETAAESEDPKKEAAAENATKAGADSKK